MALDHYVSQVHLKRFYSPELNGLMYAHRKTDLKQFTPNAKSVCRIDEGNTNDFLKDPRAVEIFLKKVEGKYNSALSSFISGKVDEEHIYALAGFTAYILSCSPAAMRVNSTPLEHLLETTAKHLDGQNKIPEPPDVFKGKNIMEMLSSGEIFFDIDPKFPQAIGVAHIIDKVVRLGNYRWEFLMNENEDCPFFTSDFPVVHESSNFFNLPNLIVPLSPNSAIRIVQRENNHIETQDANFAWFSTQRKKIKRNEAIAINRLIIRSAEETVFCRDNWPWVLDFIKKNRNFRTGVKSHKPPITHAGNNSLIIGIVPHQYE